MSTIYPPSITHDAAVQKRLRDNPDLAAEYLKAALEESADDPHVLLVALRHVALARGMSHVAEQAGVNRESLYRALSPRGNPTVKTLSAVLKTVGLRLTAEPAPSQPEAALKSLHG